MESEAYDACIGVDEVGRGPLAGPVVAAACYIPLDVNVEGILDSKKISERKRTQISEKLRSHPSVLYAEYSVDNLQIDTINIRQATLFAMKQAVHLLLDSSIELQNKKCIAIVDGIDTPTGLSIDSHTLIKADQLVLPVSAASILAKVSRDQFMINAHNKYPQFGFASHKGYPTKKHLEALSIHKPCPLHRLTFSPLNKL